MSSSVRNVYGTDYFGVSIFTCFFLSWNFLGGSGSSIHNKDCRGSVHKTWLWNVKIQNPYSFQEVDVNGVKPTSQVSTKIQLVFSKYWSSFWSVFSENFRYRLHISLYCDYVKRIRSRSKQEKDSNLCLKELRVPESLAFLIMTFVKYCNKYNSTIEKNVRKNYFLL